jgi:hypothetical protein
MRSHRNFGVKRSCGQIPITWTGCVPIGNDRAKEGRIREAMAEQMEGYT